MRKANKFLFLIWSILLFAVLMIFYLPKCGIGNSKEGISKIEVWTKKTGNDNEKQILLPNNLYKEKGESVEIYTQLPEEFEVAQTLCFWTYFQEVEVYLGNEKIYFTEEDRFGEAVLSQWNYVEVPEGANGQKLTICLETPYDSYEFHLTEVVFGSTKDIEEWILKSYGFNQLIDISLIIIGIGLIVFSSFQKINNRYKICHVCFGLTVLLFGIWLRTGMKGCPYYFFDLYTNAFLSYLAFFLIPIPLLIYVKTRALRRSLLVKICDGMLFAECLSVLLVFIMQAFNIRDFQESLFVGQIGLSVCVVWALFVALLYYIKERKSISILTVINAFLLIIVVAAEDISSIKNMVMIRSDIITRICILMIITLEFIMFFSHLREKEKLQKKIEEENKNLQLQVLTGQVRPHFILNTLGAIRSLIRQDADRASDLLYDFSKYIRKNMEKKDYSKPIPFLEELDYIETYLNLEKLRFNEKLKVKYDIQEDGFWILPLTIQPFVENAVKHGLLEMKGGGTVWISTYKRGKNIVVEIRDNGVGFNTANFGESLEKRNSVGMKSAIFRLKNEMHGKCELNSSMTAGRSGTCIKIFIPEEGAYRNENNNCRR